MIFMWLMVQLCPFQNSPLWEKLNIAPFVIMINDKPVIACYFLQYGKSSSFHIFSLFFLLKGSSDITAKQT